MIEKKACSGDMWVLIQVIDSLGIKGGSAANDAVNCIALFK
jgi:hypothetical protein